MMIKHPAQSLFIGCFPMGAATLINSALVSHSVCLWLDGATQRNKRLLTKTGVSEVKLSSGYCGDFGGWIPLSPISPLLVCCMLCASCLLSSFARGLTLTFC